ncbi:restriction endonuclease subunit S [Bifidobacterium adolescentis]|uniref:restriction endonuclease subunit S n=2 Tax=Bifidobacterium adolescentis TaxID=1680 RepID=UPI003219A315|nr:restriction endonuclease subunit S [Bifidobacterium adolescentis]
MKDETKNVILVFVRLNLGTHLIGGFPNLRSELLLVHLSLLIAVPANQCTVPRATAHLSQEYRTPAWEQRKLGELFEESDERASDREILSVSVANGIYPASESDRETNPGASLANYKIVHFGDVVYNSMRMWQGAVDASRYDGIVSPAYVVTRPNSEVYARFFARLLRQPMLLKQYQQVSQGNSKDTQVLKFDDFASIGISMPASENEQRQIGAFFDRLDSLITLHQRKYCGVVSWMLGVALVRLGSESDGAFGEMKHVLR